MFSNIVTEIRNGTLLCKLNNPQKKNALSKALISELSDFVDTCGSTPDINSIVFMSNSEGFFCTGADLKERLQMKNEQEIEEFVGNLRALFNRIYHLELPTFAFIGSYFLKFGFDL
jgi:methylglutaconyl-CoA hydratase